jgi:hypothetical protein
MKLIRVYIRIIVHVLLSSKQNLLNCFIFRSTSSVVNNTDVVYISLYLHAVGNHVYDILMIGNSGQIFRFVFSCAVHVCCKLEYLSNNYDFIKSSICVFYIISNIRCKEGCIWWEARLVCTPNSKIFRVGK